MTTESNTATALATPMPVRYAPDHDTYVRTCDQCGREEESITAHVAQVRLDLHIRNAHTESLASTPTTRPSYVRTYSSELDFMVESDPGRYSF